jgi:hypothetical protein
LKKEIKKAENIKSAKLKKKAPGVKNRLRANSNLTSPPLIAPWE